MYLVKEGVAPTLTPLLGWSAGCKTERRSKITMSDGRKQVLILHRGS